MLEHMDTKYHQFYNNCHSKYYKIYFYNKNKNDVLKRYISCFCTSHVNRQGWHLQYLRIYYIWMAHWLFPPIKKHVFFIKIILSMMNTLAHKTENFVMHLDYFVYLRPYNS